MKTATIYDAIDVDDVDWLKPGKLVQITAPLERTPVSISGDYPEATTVVRHKISIGSIGIVCGQVSYDIDPHAEDFRIVLVDSKLFILHADDMTWRLGIKRSGKSHE